MEKIAPVLLNQTTDGGAMKIEDEDHFKENEKDEASGLSDPDDELSRIFILYVVK
jgi:hypothetical protein